MGSLVLFFYPGWEATMENGSTLTKSAGALGLNLTRCHVSMVTRCYPSTTQDLKIYSVMYIYIYIFIYIYIVIYIYIYIYT